MSSPDSPPLRVLVADDEPLACERIAALIEKRPDAEVVSTASDGLESAAQIREEQPNVAFLDVEMPVSGPDVIEEVGPEAVPVTVLVTAYKHFPGRAFELGAVDFLLKPFTDERFDEALTVIKGGFVIRLHPGNDFPTPRHRADLLPQMGTS